MCVGKVGLEELDGIEHSSPSENFCLKLLFYFFIF